MAALDVISIQQAKDWLQIDQSYSLSDEQVEACVAAAVDWVERKTDYYLYARDVEYTSEGCQIEVYGAPVNSVVAVNDKGDEVNVKQTKRATKVLVSAQSGATITVNIGYDSVGAIPNSLVMAVRKLITYFFENRDMYTLDIPNDVQMLINPYRRAVGIA